MYPSSSPSSAFPSIYRSLFAPLSHSLLLFPRPIHSILPAFTSTTLFFADSAGKSLISNLFLPFPLLLQLSLQFTSPSSPFISVLFFPSPIHSLYSYLSSADSEAKSAMFYLLFPLHLLLQPSLQFTAPTSLLSLFLLFFSPSIHPTLLPFISPYLSSAYIEEKSFPLCFFPILSKPSL